MLHLQQSPSKALDATTGQERWSFYGQETSEEMLLMLVMSCPAVAGGMVFAGSSDSRVYALDAATGQQRWAFKTGRQITGLAVANGVVFAGSLDEYIYALDAATGQKIWASKIAGAFIPDSPAVAGGVVFVGTDAIGDLAPFSSDNRLGPEDLFALDAATGRKLWAVDAGRKAIGPSVAAGMVFVGSDEGKVYAFGGEAAAVDQVTPAGVMDVALAEEHFNRGEVYAERRRLIEAIREYQAALHINPNLVAAHVGLGTVYNKQGRVDEALRQYQVALRINPNYCKLHDGLSAVYRSQNRLAEARREADLARYLRTGLHPADYHEAYDFDLNGLAQEGGYESWSDYEETLPD